MTMTRRGWIAAAGAAPLAQVASSALAAAPPARAAFDLSLPAKTSFAPMGVTYLNSGTMHPFSLGARQAVTRYLSARSVERDAPHFGLDDTETQVRAKFAALINAKPEEICLVPSTTAGEQLVVKALNIPQSGGRIVTDTLHFFGSFYLYEEMAKAGMDVVWLKPRDGKSIDIADVEAAVNKGTKLVALSLVSTINGFQHDLKRVCEIAHAKGAYVYADIVHAAGAVPVDVRDSGVDFAACATYKWLMGDFGLGFLYVREDLLDRVKRIQFGYYQLEAFQPHVYPFDPPSADPTDVADYRPMANATGHFATGTTSGAGVAQLDYSIDYIRQLGVEAIQRHRQPLLDKARRELERKGFPCMTPEGATSPLLTFVHEDAGALSARLDAARVKITLSKNRFRISPSVFNDMADIDQLLQALA